jgi:hypothetical protein
MLYFFDEFIKIPFQNILGVIDFYAGPVIFNHLIRMQDIRADLVAPIRGYFGTEIA